MVLGFGADCIKIVVSMATDRSHRLTMGKTKALIFGMWQWLMVLYINCASHAPGVKFGHAPGLDSLHRLTIGKTKKIFFSETTRPTALIFGM